MKRFGQKGLALLLTLALLVQLLPATVFATEAAGNPEQDSPLQPPQRSRKMATSKPPAHKRMRPQRRSYLRMNPCEKKMSSNSVCRTGATRRCSMTRRCIISTTPAHGRTLTTPCNCKVQTVRRPIAPPMAKMR